MTWQVYPQGADIGLHESLINSITLGRSGFFSNYFHMGGGVSATNPGYHVFVIFIRAMTGLPDYLSHSIVASFFSAFAVLGAYLVVRRIFSESASLLFVFLMAFSAGDIEMLSWGGYPNIIALFLISLVFYFYLQYSKFPASVYLVITSLLIGGIFLTHVFSGFIFVAITVLTVFVCVLFSRKVSFSRYQALPFLTPIFLGCLLVSPYLFKVFPVYFGSDSTITGEIFETKLALLETRLVSFEVLFLILITVVLFLFLFRLYKGKFFAVSSILFVMWILVPAIMTQSYLFGLFLDFRRFVYFLYLPLTICFVLLILSGVGMILKLGGIALNSNKKSDDNSIRRWFNRVLLLRSSKKIVYLLLVLIFLVLSLFFIPLFTPPNVGFEDSSYYQVMTPQGYDAIQWIKNSTPTNSILVSDAEFGWWLGGFAQRPTLSAVSPQYLILAHELEPATVARNLLESNYFVDNGMLRVSCDKAPTFDSSFEILARIDDSQILQPFFSIKDAEISLLYRDNGESKHLRFSEFPITNMQTKNGSGWASFTISRGDDITSFTLSITMYSGVRFAKISLNLQSKIEGLYYDWLHVPILCRGVPVQYGNSVGFVDGSVHSISQLVFPENQLNATIVLQENPDFFELVGNLEGKSNTKVEFFAGFYPYDSSEIDQNNYLQNLILNNSQQYLNSISNSPLVFFDYQAAIKAWNISYIIITQPVSSSKFVNDHSFSLVYKNNEISIFKVENHHK